MRQQRLMARVLKLAVAGVLIVGCGGGSSRRAAAAASPAVTVRTCSMVGFGGLAADYRRRALIFGPLALGNLRTYAADQSLPGRVDGRYGAYEVIAIVNAGARPVLSLPRSEWRTVGLLYNPSKFRNDGAYRIQDARSGRPLSRVRVAELQPRRQPVRWRLRRDPRSMRPLPREHPARTGLPGGVSSGRAVPQSVVLLTSAPFAQRSQ